MTARRSALMALLALVAVLAAAAGARAATCSAGEYLHYAQAACVQCPAGYYCSGSTTAPVPCSAGSASSALGQSSSGACSACATGYYALAGAATCSPCSAGYACPAKTADRQLTCSSGAYSTGAATTCTTCPAGYACASTSAAPVACPAGRYSVGNATQCTACPAGSSCASASSTPTACTRGFYSAGGDITACTACPAGTTSNAPYITCAACSAGFSCADPTAAPVACSTGAYSLQGINVACTNCPAGFYCASASTPPTPCATGKYSSGGATVCADCPAGFSCTDPTAAPAACAAGTYAQLGDGACQTCPAGYSCATTTAAPVACSTGSYALRGDGACTACPAGAYCPSTTQGPQFCASGTYSTGSATVCTDCAAGSFCPVTTAAGSACPTGFYSRARSINCTECPAGRYCASAAGTPLDCVAGAYALPGATVCTACASGVACPSRSSAASVACPAGSYSVGAQAECTVCPAGSACPSTSSATVNACASGTFSAGGQSACTLCSAGWQCGSTDGSANTPCRAGTYATAGATVCTVCPSGSACPYVDQAVVLTCDAGTYSVGRQTNCTRCARGYACPSTTASTASACAAGTYSVGAQAACTQCPAGYACPLTYAAHLEQCQPGTYSVGVQAACTVCPAGYSCANASTGPVPCATGYYSATQARACTICPAGFRCATASVSPVGCAAGTYSAAGATACSACNAGYSCPAYSTTATPSAALCRKGYYCPTGTASEQPCPAGTYGNSTGALASSDCIRCPAGYYCPAATVDPYAAAQVCPRGYWCPSGTAGANDNACAAGYFNPTLGASNSSACLPCSAGRYCPAASINEDLVCSAGRYCPPYSGSETLCAAGTHSDGQRGLTSQAECRVCPTGHYCVAGSSAPQPCSAGTYQPNFGMTASGACLPCQAGMACPTAGLSRPNVTCSEGYYCPSGTTYPNQFPCNAGTWTNRTDVVAASQCDICPERFSCAGGNGPIVNPPVNCSRGYYCPPGTSSPTMNACPAGSYSDRNDLAASSECYQCPAGYYCTSGRTAPNNVCTAGYYCPAGSTAPTTNACPAGTYSTLTNLSRSDQCTDCPQGYYCGTAATQPQTCASGTYGARSNLPAATSCTTCPAGSYCLTAATAPLDCTVGMHSASGVSVCSTCTVGYYCDSNTTSTTFMLANRACPNGTYCPAGTSREPDLQSFKCPVGKYCLTATASPASCPNGTYNAVTGRGHLDACLACPAGYYCDAGASTPSGVCTPGYYCPLSSTSPTQTPCPRGTFRNLTRGESEQSCAVCPSGAYCLQATSDPTDCPRGYYCTTGTHSPEPCPLGTYGNSTGVRTVDECVACPAGQYCDGLGLSAPTGYCDAGFYCSSRAYTSAPPNDATGGVCPAGGYCVIGSATPTSCPAGTYNNYTGGRSSFDCFACDPGYYCSGSANPAPTGQCTAGYYCTGSASSPTQFETPAGTYTTAGSPAPLACPLGSYQPEKRTSVCLSCLEGYYCPNTSMTTPNICPQGSYCPTGASSPTPCPAGTYSATLGLKNDSQCTACPPAQYCGSQGLTAPSGSCLAGHYCVRSSPYSTPCCGASFGSDCPAGSYCPDASYEPTPCPAGTYSPSLNLHNVSQCLPCSAGAYCNQTGLSAPSGNCSAGYYCVGSATVATPPGDATGAPCTTGHYCPSGTATPLQCALGTFMNATGASACTQCEAGSYCVSDFTFMRDCPQGSYCPAGTGAYTPRCLNGTFSAATRLATSSQCTSCSPGAYCATLGLTAPSASCAAGYYCVSGAITPYADGGVGGICPAGHYCLSGDSSPRQCPVGTFMAQNGSISVSNCTQCTPGYYCDTAGISAVTGPCQIGYYCTGGASTPAPNDTITGSRCPAGSYCPAASPAPITCAAGTYMSNVGASVCAQCPRGYYCPNGTTDFLAYPCPAGYYCPNGTRHANEFACPAGTYQNETVRAAASECLSCPPAQYCGSTGLSAPSGPCSAGWYCVGGAVYANPNDTVTGSPCPIGAYCPSGSSGSVACSAGMYCDRTRLSSPAGACSPGYYCLASASTPTPTDGVTGNVCPAGFYCLNATFTPQSCQAGTYSPSFGNQNASMCRACTAGSYCAQPNLTAPSAPCDAGYYCPGGQIVANPAAYTCPVGAYCVSGSPAPTNCSAGTYQDATAQSACKTCLGGFFCHPSAPSTLQNCPIGHYCPNGTQFGTQFPCANGTYSNRTGLVASSDCTPCSPGYYCSGTGLTTPTAICAAGHYCTLGASSPVPTDNSTGNSCPAGSYCIAGSVAPTPCPAGTTTSSSGNTQLSDCLPCPAGQYCASSGGSGGVTGLCDPGFVCTGGSSTARPVNSTGGYICTPGHYCQSGALSEAGCPAASYQPNYGQEVCLDCPQRAYCPVVNMSAVYTCPAGFYCPINTSAPQPCPSGTYSNRTALASAAECSSCGRGLYCNASALTAPTGSCAAGFYCDGGSASPTPSGVYPANAPCPAGSYCTNGTLFPAACAIGTFLNTTHGAASSYCIACTPGSYCETTGLTAPTGYCAAGYYCPSGTLNAVATPSTSICPAGTYCPAGSAAPLGCPDGTFQDTAMQSACKGCPAGAYCLLNATAPTVCPVGSYCLANVSAPTPCANGTYGATTALQAQADCLACPPGEYCVFGARAGNCSAGYLCRGSSDTPQPAGPYDTVGGACQLGHYCPIGTTLPISCPSGTVRATTGGALVSDCSTCPAGYKCIEGDPVPISCPASQYCPFNSSIGTCSAGTWSNVVGATNSSVCQQCPAGYYCPSSGQVLSTQYPCPVGQYCPAGSVAPLDCPAGTFRNATLGTALADCTTCTVGSYCTQATNVTIPCGAGRSCPAGSSDQTICPAGTYCPPQTGSPITCPAGFYCPLASNVTLVCPDGFYCPLGSATPTLCPLGTKFSATVTDRSSPLICETCAAGTYGADPARSTCATCAAGYICLAGATTATPTNVTSEKGYACPAGSYCPAGATSETPCPAGTYRAAVAAASVNDCTLCAANSFQYMTGQVACLPCGSSAYSSAGATACSCNGTNRAFQQSDGSCICVPRYQFYDSSFALSEADSTIDCQPIVYDQCTTGVRDASGSCVSESTYCASFCSTGSGTFSVVLGICDCTGQTAVDQVCNTTCQATENTVVASSTTITVTSNGVPAVYTITSIPGFVGSVSTCTSTSCSMRVVKSESSGLFSGLYNPAVSYLASLLTTGTFSAKRSLAATERSDPRAHAELRAALAPSALEDAPLGRASGAPRAGASTFVGIDNPTICIVSGTGVMWDVSASRLHFPVYVKDSLLNTVSDFDYGVFRKLRDRVLYTNATTSVFAFTFTTVGIYVFSDYTSTDQLTIVSVVASGTTCNTDATVVPTSSRALTSVGVTQTASIQLAPNWVLIGTLLGGLVVVLAIVVGVLFYFRRRAWKALGPSAVRYREVGNQYQFLQQLAATQAKTAADLAAAKAARDARKSGAKGAKVAAAAAAAAAATAAAAGDVESTGDAAAGAAGAKRWRAFDSEQELEGFNVKHFYDKLDVQRLDIKKHLAREKDELKELFDKLIEQTSALRDAVAQTRKGDMALRKVSGEQQAQAKKREADASAEVARRKELAQQYLTLISALQAQLGEADRERSTLDGSMRRYRASALERRTRLLDSMQTVLRGNASDAAVSETLQDGARLFKMYDKLGEELRAAAIARGATYSRATGLAQTDAPSTAALGHAIADRNGKAVDVDLLFANAAAPAGSAVAAASSSSSSSGAAAPPRALDPSSGLIERDPLTGLFVPVVARAKMLVKGRATAIAPGEYFVHPRTGRLVPFVGHTAFDPESRAIVVLTACAPDAHDPARLLPYVPFPLADDAAAATQRSARRGHTQTAAGAASAALSGAQRLAALAGKVDLRPRTTFADPVTGLRVPLLAVSIDPTSGNPMPLGGTYTDPFTGQPRPIELEQPMYESSGKRLVPIVAVGFSTTAPASADAPAAAAAAAAASTSTSFALVPLGGIGREPAGHKPRPLCLETPMYDPLEERPVALGTVAASLGGEALVPCVGAELGHAELVDLDAQHALLALLDAEQAELRAALDKLRTVHAACRGAPERATRDSAIAAQITDVRRVLERCGDERTRRVADLLDALSRARRRAGAVRIAHRERLGAREAEMRRMAEKGGVEGVMLDPISGAEVPILIGGRMLDKTSGLEVPIIGVGTDKNGHTVPLGGTVLDKDGNEVPLRIGALVKDPQSGALAPVTGASLDPVSNKVTPVTVPSGTDTARVTPQQRAEAERLQRVLDDEETRRATFARDQDGAREQLERARDALLAKLRATLDRSDGLVDADQMRELQNAARGIKEQLAQLERDSRSERETREEMLRKNGGLLGAQLKESLGKRNASEETHEQEWLDAEGSLVDSLLGQIDKLRDAERKFHAKYDENQLKHTHDPHGEAMQVYAAELKGIVNGLSGDVGTKRDSLSGALADLHAARDDSGAALHAATDGVNGRLSALAASLADRSLASLGGGLPTTGTIAADIKRILDILSTTAGLPQNVRDKLQLPDRDTMLAAAAAASAAAPPGAPGVPGAAGKAGAPGKSTTTTTTNNNTSSTVTQPGAPAKPAAGSSAAAAGSSAAAAGSSAAAAGSSAGQPGTDAASVEVELKKKLAVEQQRMDQVGESLKQKANAQLDAAARDELQQQERLLVELELTPAQRADLDARLASERDALKKQYEQELEYQRGLLEEQQRRKLERMRDKHEAERRQHKGLPSEAVIGDVVRGQRDELRAEQREADAEREALERRAREAYEKRMAQTQRDLQAELNGAASEAERARILERYKANQANLAKEFVATQSSQRESLEARLKARRDELRDRQRRQVEDTLERNASRVDASVRDEVARQIADEVDADGEAAASIGALERRIKEEEQRAQAEVELREAQKRLTQQQADAIKARVAATKDALDDQFKATKAKQESELQERLRRQKERRARLMEKAAAAAAESSTDSNAAAAAAAAAAASSDDQDLLKKHMLEAERLRQEESEETLRMRARLEAEEKRRRDELEAEKRAELEREMSDGQRREILRKYEQREAQRSAEMERVRASESDQLRSRLKKRRDDLRRKQDQEQRELIENAATELEAELAASTPASAADMAAAAAAAAAAASAQSTMSSEEAMRIKREAEEKLRRMQEEQRKERARLEQQLEADMQREQARELEELEKATKRRMEEKSRKHEADLKAMGDSAAAAQKKAEIMAQHQAQMAQLEGELATSASAQEALFQRKRDARKKRMLRQQQEEHERQLRTLREQQQKDAEAAELERVKEEERRQIAEKLAQSAADAENKAELVEQTMYARHGRELTQLLQQFKRRLAAEQKRVADDMDEIYAERRLQVETDLAAARDAALESAANEQLAPAERQARVDEVETRFRERFASLSGDADRQRTEALDTLKSTMYRELAEERMALRRRQLKEIADMCGENDLADAWMTEMSRAAEREEASFEKMKLDMERKWQARQEEMAREQAELQARMEDDARRKLAEYQEKLESDAKAREEATKAEIDRRRKQIEDAERVARDEYNREENEQLKQRILRANQEKMAQMQNDLNGFVAEQEDSLARKLMRKRKELMQRRAKQVEREKQAEIDRVRRERELEAQREREREERELADARRRKDEEEARRHADELAALKRQQLAAQVEAARAALGPSAGASAAADALAAFGALGAEPVTLTTGEPIIFGDAPTTELNAATRSEWYELVKETQSPLIERLSRLEEHLRAHMNSVHMLVYPTSGAARPAAVALEAPAAAPAPVVRSEPAAEPVEAPMARRAPALRALTSLDSLSAAETTLYQFGAAVVRRVTERLQLDAITVLLASELPDARDSDRNAFKHAYLFEAHSRVLFVHTSRLASVGGYVLCLMHGLAHAQRATFANDHDERFVRELYACVRVVCAEFFYSQQDAVHGVAPRAASFTALYRELLDEAFPGALAASFAPASSSSGSSGRGGDADDDGASTASFSSASVSSSAAATASPRSVGSDVEQAPGL